MLWTDCRLLAFDTETTGLQAFDGDRIIEFGAVELFVNEELEVSRVKQHQFMINPGMPIPREVSNITGIHNEDVAKAPRFEEKAKQIHHLLQDAIVIAHNFGFDLGFLRTEFARSDMTWPATRAEIDTLTLARRMMRSLRSKRLEKVAEELKVELNNAHRAVDDAEACGRVFIKMAKRYNAPRELEDMLDWAIAVGPPPNNEYVGLRDRGVPEFLQGKKQGQTIEECPDFLQWMTIAKRRVGDEWQFRYPQPLRRWALRWLRARTAGENRSAARGGGKKDWNIDPTPWRTERAKTVN